MVERAVLPAEAREALARLEETIHGALGSECPHVALVGRGAIERGENPYDAPMFGGQLLAYPSLARIQHTEEDQVRRLFQEVVHRAPGLRVVIVRGQRPTRDAPWAFTAKLVSGVELDALRRRRAALDKSIRGLLEALRADDKADIHFGRFGDDPGLKIAHFDENGRRSEGATPAWEGHYAEAARLYADAGLELVSAIWKLNGRRSRGGGRSAWEVSEAFY